MFEQLGDVPETPGITRRTVITLLLMLFLLGIMVGAQLTALILRHEWSSVGLGETFLVSVLLWKLSVPLRKAFKSLKLEQNTHAS
jgi:hypothetical protein